MLFDFENKAELVLDAMANHARSIGAEGVAVVAWLADGNDIKWIGRMSVVDSIFKEIPNAKGYNLVAVAWSKAAEMMATKQNSGTTERDYMFGELGYQGGSITKVGNGYLITAFSGASSEEDFAISKIGAMSI